MQHATHASPVASEDNVVADDVVAGVSIDSVSRERIGRRVVVGALVSGSVADLLLRGHPLGANLTIYLVSVAVAIAVTARERIGVLPQQSSRLLAVASLFAALLALRDSGMLAWWNLAASTSALALAAASAAPVPLASLARARLRDAVAWVAQGLGDAVCGAIPFCLFDARHVLRVPARRLYAARLAGRALALAAVATLGFGALLAAGDPVFAEATSWLLRWDPSVLAGHVFFVGVFVWPIVGVLRGTTLVTREHVALDDPRLRSLNRMDVLAVLTALNVLFAAFVVLQLRALFGGQAYVLATTGLTLAEYARGGFFTLVATAGLVLVVLLVLNAMARDESLGSWRASRRLAHSLSMLVGVVMASAAVRMALYVRVFGPSTDRVYASVTIGWLAVLFVWFSVTVLRDRPRRFLIGSLGSAWATLLLLNAVNPDRLVVQSNLRRAAEGAEFDLRYATEDLSADAVPALATGIAGAPPEVFARFTTGGELTPPCFMVRQLLVRWGSASIGDGPGWNLARARAREAVVAREASLRVLSCDGPARLPDDRP